MRIAVLPLFMNANLSLYYVRHNLPKMPSPLRRWNDCSTRPGFMRHKGSNAQRLSIHFDMC